MIPCVKLVHKCLRKVKFSVSPKGWRAGAPAYPGDEAIPGPPASIVCRAERIKKLLSEELDQVKLRRVQCLPCRGTRSQGEH